jgi:hypothetical protein
MNCKTLLRRTQEAVEELKIEATFEKVESYQDIAAYGILKTPGLVFNEKVVSAGNVPTVEKIKELLIAYQCAQ